jgi:RNA polymerase sigma-70 factor (ECF subfamily)
MTITQDERLRRGDTQALSEAFAEHRERLLRTIALRLDPRLAGRLGVEDVLQEAWLAAAQRLPHYAADGFTRPFTWLRVVVLQTLVDVHRHHLGAHMRDPRRELRIAGGRAQPEASSAALALQLSGRGTTPSGAAMRGEAGALVVEALDSLSAADREVIALRHFEDLANEEVAELLGITGKAASIRYIRALARLKTAMERVGLSLGDLRAR